MQINLSNDAARVLAKLLQDDFLVQKAKNNSAHDPVPTPEDLQAALDGLDPGESGDEPVSDADLSHPGRPTPDELSSAAASRDIERTKHFARTGSPLRFDAGTAAPEEAEIAGRVAERMGVSIQRALSLLRYSGRSGESQRFARLAQQAAERGDHASARIYQRQADAVR